MAASLSSRFQGSLVGAIVGDCIGSVFEGYDWSTVIGTERVLKLVGKIESDHESKDEASKKRRNNYYTYTDDSAMARSVAKSLIQNNGLDTIDMAKRFTKEYFKESDRGYGGSVAVVFQSLADTNYEDVFKPARDQFEGQGSYGNGGAMRICPAGLFAEKKNYDFSQLKEISRNITLLTHSHPQAIQGAILQSYAVQLALRTEKLDVDSFLQELTSKMQTLEQEDLERRQEIKEDSKNEDMEAGNTSSEREQTDAKEEKNDDFPYTAKLAKIRDFVKREKIPDPNEIRDELGVFISALDSVPAAIYCFLRASQPIDELKGRNAFERTIIYAISLGGDTDTVATMAGSIAGAYYGLDDIPSSWQLSCEGRKDAMKDAELLYNLT